MACKFLRRILGKKMDEYGFRPKDYLNRAKKRLEEKKYEGLFYAALELRSFVEARQNQYIESQHEYINSIPRSWKIGKQWKSLKKIFSVDKIQNIQFHHPKGAFLDMYYVPVSQELKDSVVRFGNLLHYPEGQHTIDDAWWEDTRAQIINAYTQAWMCCQGNVLCPAMIDDGGVLGQLKIEINSGDFKILKNNFSPGTDMIVKVSYLDSPPASWECDILL